MEIPNITKSRARALYNAGLRTPEGLAAAEPDAVVAALLAGSHRSRAVSEELHRGLMRKAARTLLAGARQLLRVRAGGRREAQWEVGGGSMLAVLRELCSPGRG
eukprot:355543-Chlamydomonas_euryale.AAC.6